jgi:hypothetical protein
MTREGYHKHKAIIEAWVGGAAVQFKNLNGEWEDVNDPVWHMMSTYRLKPVPVHTYFSMYLLKDGQVRFGDSYTSAETCMAFASKSLCGVLKVTNTNGVLTSEVLPV